MLTAERRFPPAPYVAPVVRGLQEEGQIRSNRGRHSFEGSLTRLATSPGNVGHTPALPIAQSSIIFGRYFIHNADS